MDMFHHREYRLAAQTSHPTTNPSPHLDSATPPQPVDLAAPPFQAKRKMDRPPKRKDYAGRLVRHLVPAVPSSSNFSAALAASPQAHISFCCTPHAHPDIVFHLWAFLLQQRSLGCLSWWALHR